MTMDELDDLLRDTFRAREHDVLDPAGLAASARSDYARRTVKRRQLMAVSAAGVLAVGGGSALALARHASGTPSITTNISRFDRTGNGNGSSPGATPGQGAPTASAPAGTRAWSSHGLQVDVPQAWKANQTTCGTPTASTVVIGGGAVPMCALNSAPAVDVVTFAGANDLDVSPKPALHPTTVGTHSALTGTERIADGRTVTVLVVPDLDVSVTVKSKSTALVAGIIASARIVDTDANGCPSRITTVEPAGKPQRPGAQSTMVPDQPDKPVKAIVCHYATGVAYHPGQPTPTGPTPLVNGSTIAPDQVAVLAHILNTLTPGLAAWDGLPGYCPPPAREGYLFRFTYASGQPVDVYLHGADCDHDGFSNGAVTGFMSQKFVEGVQKFLPDMGFEAMGSAVR